MEYAELENVFPVILAHQMDPPRTGSMRDGMGGGDGPIRRLGAADTGVRRAGTVGT